MCECVCGREETSSPECKKMRLDPFAELRDRPSTSTANEAIVESAGTELAKYKAMRVPAAYGTALQFWKENAADYPIMSETARRIFCISASSAQSERDFSSVGHTITDTRSRLSADKIEAIELVRWGLRGGFV